MSGSPPDARCHKADRPEISVTGFMLASQRCQRSFAAAGRPSDEKSCSLRELSDLWVRRHALQERRREAKSVSELRERVRREDYRPLTPRMDPRSSTGSRVAA